MAGKTATALKVRNKPGVEGEWNTGKTRTAEKEIRPRNQPTNIYSMSLACPSPYKAYKNIHDVILVIKWGEGDHLWGNVRNF